MRAGRYSHTQTGRVGHDTERITCTAAAGSAA
jgi:hypothetical protein